MTHQIEYRTNFESSNLVEVPEHGTWDLDAYYTLTVYDVEGNLVGLFREVVSLRVPEGAARREAVTS